MNINKNYILYMKNLKDYITESNSSINQKLIEEILYKFKIKHNKNYVIDAIDELLKLCKTYKVSTSDININWFWNDWETLDELRDKYKSSELKNILIDDSLIVVEIPGCGDHMWNNSTKTWNIIRQ